jgi:predicted nucleic acid-binding protein
LLMSVAFIVMLYRRRSLRGQSLSIAICKMLGTSMSSLAFLIAPFTNHSTLLSFLYISIFIYDAVYVALVYTLQRKNVWLVRESVPETMAHQADSLRDSAAPPHL